VKKQHYNKCKYIKKKLLIEVGWRATTSWLALQPGELKGRVRRVEQIGGFRIATWSTFFTVGWRAGPAN